MKSILKVDPAIYFRGLEEIKSINILENGAILIHYTITDEFMKERELYNKDRQLQLDPNEKRPILKEQDYALPTDTIETGEIIFYEFKGDER